MARLTLVPVNQNQFTAVGGVLPGIAALSGTATPGVPASGTPQSNTNAWAVAVVVTGGTFTGAGVQIGGVTVGAGAGTYFVAAGQSITLNYSVAPTWAWAAAGGDGIAAGLNAFALAWPAAATGVAFVNSSGNIWLWYYNGTQACTASYLVGQKTAGDVFPFTEEQVTLATSGQGWLGPWSPQKYNQQDGTQFSGSPGGLVTPGTTCIDFSNASTLVVRAYQFSPITP